MREIAKASGQRPIKFRAWSSRFKRYEKEIFDLYQDSDLGYFGDVVAGKYNGYILQQYTGLKDKDGKEIYEGDICENGDWEFDAKAYNYRIEEVKYIDNEACFIGWQNNIESEGVTCKVIGNIYENPELLKEPANETQTKETK